MICARQNLGMSDNCALCEVHHFELYNPCRGRPDKIKIPVIKTSIVEKPKDEIIIVPVKELSYNEAKRQVIDYIQTKGGKVHISEIVEKLKLDIELVSKILEE